MKATTILLAAALTTGIALPAFADRPGADWMPLDQAHRKLIEAGYQNITELEADDGYWEAKATKDGVVYKVLVDPRTGAVTQKKRSH